MWVYKPLDDVLSTRTRTAILRAVCAANAPLNGREIARRAGLSSGATSKVLRELAASGVLSCRDQGRAKTYELAGPESELVRQLRELFAAEKQRYEAIVEGLVEGANDILSVVLFGSEARGDARPGSDTDILIVVEHKTDELEARLRDKYLDLAEQYSLALSWHVADVDELCEWDETGNQLWQNVLREGIKLNGESIESLRRRWQRGETT